MLALGMVGCSSTSAGNNAASVAESELSSYASGSEGEKYWRFMGKETYEAWCADFVSYCAEKSGLVDAGYATKSSSVNEWIKYYKENKTAGEILTGGSATPKRGDFIVWDQSTDSDARYESHIGIITAYDANSDRVTVIEGNWNNTLAKNYYSANEGVSYYLRPGGTGKITMNGCSSSLSGETTEIPEGLGTVHSYMGWSTITAISSNQYKLREQAGENYDVDGFAKIGNRYVIACTSTFGDVGDYIDWTLDNGEVISSVIGDIKSQGDEGCNKWGHQNGDCIIEFVVDKDTWYGRSRPGDPTQGYHDEWYKQAVVSATKVGSFWNGDDANATSSIDLFLSSCSASLNGEGQSYVSASERGKAIVAACKSTPWPGANLCATWTSNVYANAGLARPGGNGNDPWKQGWATSKNTAELEVGMIISSNKSSSIVGSPGYIYGHIGIYIGDGKVMDSCIEGIRTCTLEEWLQTSNIDGNYGWGWPPNV